jgi:hypothetical protein
VLAISSFQEGYLFYALFTAQPDCLQVLFVLAIVSHWHGVKFVGLAAKAN